MATNGVLTITNCLFPQVKSPRDQVIKSCDLPDRAAAYTLVPSMTTDQQLPVISLWMAGATLAIPRGPGARRPVVAGRPRGLVVSTTLTAALVAPAAVWLVRGGH